MQFDWELQGSTFRSPKLNHLLTQSGYAKSDRFENPMAQVVIFWPKTRRLGPSDFLVEKWHGILIQVIFHDGKQQQNDR